MLPVLDEHGILELLCGGFPGHVTRKTKNSLMKPSTFSKERKWNNVTSILGYLADILVTTCLQTALRSFLVAS